MEQLRPVAIIVAIGMTMFAVLCFMDSYGNDNKEKRNMGIMATIIVAGIIYTLIRFR